MLKSGNLFKLGDGPINYNWNLRFMVLDGNFTQIKSYDVEAKQELSYYLND